MALLCPESRLGHDAVSGCVSSCSPMNAHVDARCWRPAAASPSSCSEIWPLTEGRSISPCCSTPALGFEKHTALPVFLKGARELDSACRLVQRALCLLSLPSQPWWFILWIISCWDFVGLWSLRLYQWLLRWPSLSPLTLSSGQHLQSFLHWPSYTIHAGNTQSDLVIKQASGNEDIVTGFNPGFLVNDWVPVTFLPTLHVPPISYRWIPHSECCLRKHQPCWDSLQNHSYLSGRSFHPESP